MMRFPLLAAFLLSASAFAEPAPPRAPAAVLPRAEIAALLPAITPEQLRADDLKLVSFGTRSTFSDHAPPGRGAPAARAWIEAQFREIASRTGGRAQVSTDSYIQQPGVNRIPRAVEIANVVLTIPGDEPGARTYVMTGHYDSRNSTNEDGTTDAPGADDDGSGTVAVIEAARALSGLHPHATIIFAAVEAEEQGLYGSRHLAEGLKARGVDVEGDLNNDIVGSSLGREGVKDDATLRIFSQAIPTGMTAEQANLIGAENDSPSRELARYARSVGDAYVPGLSGDLIFRADRFLRGGDHQSFNLAGFPAIRFVEPFETFEHQHQNPRVEGGVDYGDWPKYMDFAYLARVARYNAAVLASLAMGPGLPKATVETRELTNDTVLRWTAVPRAARYEVLARRTTEFDWTRVVAATVALTARLPMSKDNWLFGVRAVDGEGRRGVVAFPLPERR